MTSPRWDVLGIGENSVDHICRVPVYPQPGGPTSKIRISEHVISPGGQVATALCTCAAMGLSTAYLGAFGTDDEGARVRGELVRRGIDVSHAVVREGVSRYAVIVVDARGERVVLWYRDAALRLEPEDIRPDIVRAARCVHVDSVDEDAALRAAAIARDAGVEVTCDIDAVTDRTAELLELVTVPILGEHVPVQLTGEPDAAAALRALRRRHGGLLCVTLGSRGAMMLAGDRLYQAPALEVDAVDTTGAGDVFRGAFIYAMLRGDAPDAILRFANAAAAISCTRVGAIGGVPGLADVQARLARGA